MHLRRFAYAYRITSAYTHARLLSLYRVLFTRLSEPFPATVAYLKLSCFDFKAQEHLRDSDKKKSDEHTEFVESMPSNLQELGCNTSIKSTSCNRILTDFHKIWVILVSSKVEDSIKIIKIGRALSGRWDWHMMADHC
ncbi:hypothetical protein EVAR_21897_1 [Eumeta japonica]|uniref:Uncharacterized protein n=1 Tax=Eumeta variegata TaxID=151549 RepID=A0A4C2A516_EUMVA|nr:hypothetical protein EVAR_21897_1 [Eumeta japonica]